MLSDAEVFRNSCAAIGLHLNCAKCELTVQDDCDPAILASFSQLLPGIRLVNKVGLELLGAPIGDRALAEQLARLKSQFQTFVERIAALDAHSSFFLLKNCCTMPRFLYTLRTSHAFCNTVVLQELDDTVRVSLANILNVSINDNQWSQAILPIKMGGLGIGSAAIIGSSAFLSSIASSSRLSSLIIGGESAHPHYDAALQDWKNKSGTQQPLPENTA